MSEVIADPFMLALGLQAEVLGPGRAKVWGQVRPEHLNMHGTAHGGFIYSLADGAFALASNSHGVPAVALSTHIEYLEAGRVGDELEAVAEEINLGHRTAHYRVHVRRDAKLIAVFTGTVFRKPD